MKALDLAAVRREAGIRQDDLADALGWNTESITDIERLRFGIDMEDYQRIRAAIARISEERSREEVTA